jgi:hypothetical protein
MVYLTGTKSQSHVTIDSQSVCLRVESTPELVTRYYFLYESCCLLSVGTPSLTRGRVCLQSALFSPLSKFNFIFILHVTCFMYVQYTQGLCHPGTTAF